MPYVKKEVRDLVDPVLEPVLTLVRGGVDAGALNYIVTRLLGSHLIGHRHSYLFMNEVLGVLEAAKLEFYRRTVAPYEDVKIVENGDVR